MSNLRHVNAIAGRLSLRPPQRRSLEILDRVTEIVPPSKVDDLSVAIDIIGSEFPSVADFERDFPSLCFALATGVGKTRLMGAFIAYLKIAHGIDNFFVLAPNLTIYNKLIADFTPNTSKYVFKGISEFAISPPILTTGENYERQIAGGGQLFPTTINIFNIAKLLESAENDGDLDQTIGDTLKNKPSSVTSDKKARLLALKKRYSEEMDKIDAAIAALDKKETRDSSEGPMKADLTSAAPEAAVDEEVDSKPAKTSKKWNDL